MCTVTLVHPHTQTARHVSNLSQSTLVETNSTPKFHQQLNSGYSQSSVSARDNESIADLSITSFKTVSPPKLSSPVSSKGTFKTSTAQLSFPPPYLDAANKPTQANHSGTSSSTLTPHSDNHTTASHSEYSPPSHNLVPNSKPHSYSPVSTSQPSLCVPLLATYTEAVPKTDTVPAQYTSLLELDKLWRKFLSSSLVNTNQEACPGSQSAMGAHLPPMTDSTPITNTAEVTTKSFSLVQHSPYSNETEPTSHTPFYNAPANHTADTNHTHLSSNMPKFIDKSVQTSQDLSLQKKTPVSFIIPITQTISDRTPAKERPSTKKPPTAFTVTFNSCPSHQPLPEAVSAKTKSTYSSVVCCGDHLDLHGSTPPCEPTALSEVLALKCPEFIVRSQRRQDRLRRMKETRMKGVKVRATVAGREKVGHGGHGMCVCVSACGIIAVFNMSFI